MEKDSTPRAEEHEAKRFSDLSVEELLYLRNSLERANQGNRNKQYLKSITTRLKELER